MGKFKGFTSVELRKPKRSIFDLSHEKRLSTRMGKLSPVFVSEAIPNDTFRVSSEVMLRLAPLLAPLMHMVNVYVHFFFIPNRLLWEDWEKFITGGRLGTDTAPIPPRVQINQLFSAGLDILDQGSLADYLGLNPIPDSASGWTAQQIDLMPFAAYYKVYQDYYRDRNYEDDTTFLPLASGTMDAENAIEIMQLKNRKWEHDYFTSALPWTQRGNEVLMPLQGSGDVTYLTNSLLKKASDGSTFPDNNVIGSTGTTALQGGQLDGATPSEWAGVPVGARIENIDTIELTSSDVSINDLRRSIRLQEWMERNALAGSRYNESIMAHFGRKTSDGRLQRAEYLGGGKVPVQINEVVTTAYSQDDSAATVPPGNMAGHGISFGNTNQFTYNCEEHGFILGVMSILPSSGYMQGSPRMFFGRNTFLDYPWPSFAHLGEQEVYKYELYSDTTNLPSDRTTQPVFGYQSRYADWKHISSSCHGDFRTSLDFWHLTRKFASSPVLGDTFVTFEDALQDRIFAVSNTDTLWCYIYNRVSVKRSLPYFGTPML